MATPSSPARTRALMVLADGEWHELDDVISAAAQVVAPGQAWRTGERVRLRQRHGHNARVRGDEMTSITTGARHVARKAVEGLVRGGRAERDGSRIRLMEP